MFTREELQAFKKPQLLRLAWYFGYDLPDRTKKSEVIDILLKEFEKMNRRFAGIDEPAVMSERVKRIYQSMNK